jgi:hypothetical protein
MQHSFHIQTVFMLDLRQEFCHIGYETMNQVKFH